jgi:hypothetical protein
VESEAVVPGDPGEDRGAGLGPSAVVSAVDQLDLEEANQLSATALSRHEPVRLIERRSPSRAQAAMQAAEVYSPPRSLWKIVPSI